MGEVPKIINRSISCLQEAIVICINKVKTSSANANSSK